MGCHSMVYSSLMLATFVLCLINLVAGYPAMDSKGKDFVPDAETNYSQDKGTSDNMLDKRIFDPIEAASNFGSFGKRYNPYRVLGYAERLSNDKSLQSSNIADILKQVLAMAMARQGKSGFPQKRQFDPIGYGMFARFG